jgi:hypothetical protein
MTHTVHFTYFAPVYTGIHPVLSDYHVVIDLTADHVMMSNDPLLSKRKRVYLGDSVQWRAKRQRLVGVELNPGPCNCCVGCIICSDLDNCTCPNNRNDLKCVTCASLIIGDRYMCCSDQCSWAFYQIMKYLPELRKVLELRRFRQSCGHMVRSYVAIPITMDFNQPNISTNQIFSGPLPPAPRLVNVELNPGPGNQTSLLFVKLNQQRKMIESLRTRLELLEGKQSSLISNVDDKAMRDTVNAKLMAKKPSYELCCDDCGWPKIKCACC